MTQKEVRQEFNKLYKEIRNFVEPHLDKFQRQRYEQKKLNALGCLPSKNEKRPLPELRSRRRSARIAIEQQQEKEKILGVKIAKDKMSLKEANVKQKKLKKDMKKKFSQPIFNEDKFNGVMKLNKHDLKKLQF